MSKYHDTHNNMASKLVKYILIQNCQSKKNQIFPAYLIYYWCVYNFLAYLNAFAYTCISFFIITLRLHSSTCQLETIFVGTLDVGVYVCASHVVHQCIISYYKRTHIIMACVCKRVPNLLKPSQMAKFVCFDIRNDLDLVSSRAFIVLIVTRYTWLYYIHKRPICSEIFYPHIPLTRSSLRYT